MSMPPMPRVSGSSALIAVVVVTVLVLASIEVVLTTRAQDRIAAVRSGQVSGQTAATGQRTDQQQLTCAIWAALSAEALARIPADVQEAADRICADVPTPAPTP